MPAYVLGADTNEGNHKITDDQYRQLELLFFMDGITPHAAARQVGIHPTTAKRYFDDWAEKIVSDPEHERWIDRQKRVRARALEGLSMKIMTLTKRKHVLERIYGNLIYQKPKEGKEPTEIQNPAFIEHDKVLAYESRILAIDRHLAELQAEYDAIDAKPPADIILRKELLMMINDLNIPQ